MTWLKEFLIENYFQKNYSDNLTNLTVSHIKT